METDDPLVRHCCLNGIGLGLLQTWKSGIVLAFIYESGFFYRELEQRGDGNAAVRYMSETSNSTI